MRSSHTSQTPSTTTSHPIPCQLTMFSMNHFRGESINLTENLDNLATLNFDNKVASLKVVGNCYWTLYNEINFEPDQGHIFLRPGDYPSVTDIRAVFKKASSAEKL